MKASRLYLGMTASETQSSSPGGGCFIRRKGLGYEWDQDMPAHAGYVDHIASRVTVGHNTKESYIHQRRED